MRYCCDWNPEAGPSTWRNCWYSVGVKVSSTAHCSNNWRWICLTRARIFRHVSVWSVDNNAVAARNSWMINFIHSSLTWCWTMNSISSWWVGSLSGFCADSKVSSCR